MSNNSAAPESLGPASGKSFVISNIMLTNKTGTDVTVSVALRTTANSQWLLLTAVVPGSAPNRKVLTEQITLSYVNATGYKLELWAQTANAIDVVVNGLERDL